MIYTILILAVIVLGFYYNTILWLFESWMNNPYYSHGFFVPIISGYIIYNIRKELLHTEKLKSNFGIILFLAGIILQNIAILYSIRFLSGLSLIVVIFGGILYLYGWKFAKKISFPILFLVFMIPIPFIDSIAPIVQNISAIGASFVASLLGVSVQRDGLLMIIPTGVFEVALECSGLKSIISLLMVSVIYAYILDKRTSVKYIVVLSAVPFAIIGNILRIALMLLIANLYGNEVAINYFHDISNILLFIIALIGIFLIGRYLK